MSAETNISECVQQMTVGFDITNRQVFSGLKAAASNILAEAKRNIKAKKITAFGQLINSGSVIIEGDTIDIGFTADHAVWVEYGRKKSAKGLMPPMAPILAWVRRKITVLSTNKKGVVRKNKSGEDVRRKVTEDEIPDIALAIARHLKYNDTPARPFLMPAYEKVKETIPELMKKFVK